MIIANNGLPESADRQQSPIRREKIEKAKQRIESGDYNRPDVLEEIVSRILVQIERES